MELELKDKINLLHTTCMGLNRIRNNLSLEEEIDVIKYCKDIVANPKSYIIRKGKNWYVEYSSIILTINAYSYTIITAHKRKVKEIM